VGGPLRLATFVAPSSPALTQALSAEKGADAEASGAVRALKPADKSEAKSNDELQGLLDRFQKEGRVKRAPGVLPLSVSFPVFGQSLYLAAELTAEGAGPSVELGYKRGTK
jgi:hypothetical protein